MRMLLIAVVLIYGMELEPAFYWYIAAGLAAVIDFGALNVKSLESLLQ